MFSGLNNLIRLHSTRSFLGGLIGAMIGGTAVTFSLKNDFKYQKRASSINMILNGIEQKKHFNGSSHRIILGFDNLENNRKNITRYFYKNSDRQSTIEEERLLKIIHEELDIEENSDLDNYFYKNYSSIWNGIKKEKNNPNKELSNETNMCKDKALAYYGIRP